MLDTIKYGNFKPLGKQKKKHQIILCHSSREAEEYLASLKFRYNGHYSAIPNYFVTRKGDVLELLQDSAYSKFFNDDKINQNAVIICLENMGWLEKKPLSNYYINWIGSIYNEQVYEKKWRDYFFWQPYTQVQLEKTAEICNQVASNLNISKRSVGHNTKIEGVTNFLGIISRSNIDSRFTDLNPSFNFEIFSKYFENEQYA
jgi:N-acetyl-anhydromuramyl-L-alanine amidase AmpD